MVAIDAANQALAYLATYGDWPPCSLEIEDGALVLMHTLKARPAARYDCWVLGFEANP